MWRLIQSARYVGPVGAFPLGLVIFLTGAVLADTKLATAGGAIAGISLLAHAFVQAVLLGKSK